VAGPGLVCCDGGEGSGGQDQCDRHYLFNSFHH